MVTEPLRIAAPAKVNLFLRIVDKRPDGYHELSTWMQKLTLADEIILTPVDSGITLHCPGSNVPEDETNLACKAAALFFEKSCLPGGVDIVLTKNIPVAAGLGGGSSDAAAVLTGLNSLYAAGMNEKELMSVGLMLGADVPFFVADCHAALATGIGEKLEIKDSLTDCWFVLVNPGFPVSTKWVYENFDSSQTANFALTIEGNPFILGPACGRDLVDNFFNDLETVTIRHYSEIAVLKQKIMQFGAVASLMSGSGPTVFGVFLDKNCAQNCVDEFVREYPGKVFLTKTCKTCNTPYVYE